MLAPNLGGKKEQSGHLQFLNFLTLDPVGNPIADLSSFQRQFFFESIFRMLHISRVENAKRLEALGLTGKGAAAISSCVAGIAALKSESERQKAQARALFWKKEGKKSGQDGASRLQGTGTGAVEVSQNSLVFGPKSMEVSLAAEKLALVLDDYARGDEAKASAVLSNFQSSLSSKDYKADDLMAVLLLVIEDEIWSGEEGSIGAAKGSGAGVRSSGLPPKMREIAKESADVRLASVREMLLYYFQAHPRDYSSALAAVLGISADQEGDAEFLQERLAYWLARIGSFALSQRLLAEARKKNMDAKKCMLELGYFYDRKKKKLVLGKRTCGSAVSSKGIVDLLLSGFKGNG